MPLSRDQCTSVVVSSVQKKIIGLALRHFGLGHFVPAGEGGVLTAASMCSAPSVGLFRELARGAVNMAE